MDTLKLEKAIQYEEKLNACIEEVVVEESQDGAPKFTVTIVDANMEYMFDENLFIGRYLFIDLGLQSAHAPKIDGFVNNMRYAFDESGIPTLTLEGFGTMWDALTKNTQPIGNTFDNFTVLEILHWVGDNFGLKVDEGRTVPKDIDELLYGTKLKGTDFSNFKRISGHNKNAYGYLNALAKYYGCVFFIHGRELHFYPTSWIDSPISKEETPVDLTHDLRNLVDKKILSFWYRMDNTIPGKAGTGYNLLSFEPEVTDLNMAGYYGMSMDANSGKVSFSSDSLAMGEMGKSGAVNGDPDLSAIMTKNGLAISPKNAAMGVDGSTSPADNSKLALPHTVTAERSSATIRTRRNHPGPAKTGAELTAIAKASFRKSMWFAKANAMVYGDIDITCAIPVYIFGLGRRNIKTGEVLHNEKVCGKWYVYTVEHRVKKGQDYTCSLALRRFLQPLEPFTAGDVNKTTEGTTEGRTLIGNIAGDGVISAKDLPLSHTKAAN
jgi:hypothetical protein